MSEGQPLAPSSSLAALRADGPRATAPAHPPWWGDRWLIAACVVGLAIRALRLGAAPLWFDETITADWVRLPWVEMLRSVIADNHPPAYFAILKLWTLVAGTSAVALRLPSLAASFACIPLLAASARRVAGPSAMRWAAWLTACAPLLVHHAQEARAYALVGLLAAAVLFLLVRFLARDSDRLGTEFVAVSGLLAWSHYYGGALIFAAALVLLVTARPRWRRWLPAAVLACSASVAALLMAVLFAHHDAGGGYGFGAIAIAGVFWALLTEYTLLPSSADLHAGGAAAALHFLPVALLSAACVAPAAWWGLRKLDRASQLTVAVMVLAVIGGPYAVSLVLNVGLHPRYAMPALPAVLLLLAAAAGVREAMPWPRYALAGVTALMLFASTLHLIDPSHGREDVRGAGLWLDRHDAEAGEILVTSEEMARLARFHWPARTVRVYPPPRVTVTEANAAAIAAGMPLSAGGDTLFVVGRDWVSDPHQLLLTELRERYASCEGTAVRGIRIVCLRPANARSTMINVSDVGVR